MTVTLRTVTTHKNDLAATAWLHGSVGGASHRYREGRGLTSR